VKGFCQWGRGGGKGKFWVNQVREKPRDATNCLKAGRAAHAPKKSQATSKITRAFAGKDNNFRGSKDEWGGMTYLINKSMS